MKEKISKAAEYFVRKPELYKQPLTADVLETVLQNEGFEICKYSVSTNNKDIEEMFDTFHLREYAGSKLSFTYIDDAHKFLFIRDDQNQEKKLYLYLQEIGRIFTKDIHDDSTLTTESSQKTAVHMFTTDVMYHQYLLAEKVKRIVRKGWIYVILGVLGLAVVIYGVTLLFR